LFEKFSKREVIEISLFILFIIVLTILFFNFARANVEYDSGAYYTYLAVLTGNDKPYETALIPARNFTFGVSLVSLPVTHTMFFVSSFVEDELVGTMPDSENWVTLFPKKQVLLKEIFFKDYFVEETRMTIEWELLAGIALTSFLFLLIGIIACYKLLLLLNKKRTNLFLLVPVFVFSPILLHNIFITPQFPTLIAFGLMSLFVLFFVKLYKQKNNKYVNRQSVLLGVLLGLLLLLRYEALIFFFVTLFFIARDFKERTKYFVFGFGVMVLLYFALNNALFGSFWEFSFIHNTMNSFALNGYYIFANLLHPFSGIVFFSPLIVLGLIGLYFLQKQKSKLSFATPLLISSLLLIVVMLFRIPTFEDFSFTGLSFLEFLFSSGGAIQLVMYDANRYLTLVIPIALIGLNFVVNGIITNIKNKTNK
jgi:hypothetical protein